jgi:hypothetical protein
MKKKTIKTEKSNVGGGKPHDAIKNRVASNVPIVAMN